MFLIVLYNLYILSQSGLFVPVRISLSVQEVLFSKVAGTCRDKEEFKSQTEMSPFLLFLLIPATSSHTLPNTHTHTHMHEIVPGELWSS